MGAERRALLDRLGNNSHGAHGNTIEDATCLKGTREGILQRIEDWVQDLSSPQRVFWIYGMPGCGKSAIAATAAQRWRGRGAGALFHFRRGQNASDKRLVCALARQLESSAGPELKCAILQAVQENEDVAEDRLDKQFEVLLLSPLKNYPPESSPILIIIDALDECEDTSYAMRFIELIGRHSPSLPHNIKFIFTTRPEPPLLDTLRIHKWRSENLDPIRDADINHDIKLFIRSELSMIKELKSMSENWPSEDSVQKLVTLSEGVFQWATTAMKYIAGGSSDHRLHKLLDGSSKLHGLDDLYKEILSRAFALLEGHSHLQLLYWAIAVVIASPFPISLGAITYLFGDHELLLNKDQKKACAFMRDEVLLNIASLFFIPNSDTEPIQLMHTSIRDLLVDRRRCDSSVYFVNLALVHQELTRNCLQLMGRDLKGNICKLWDLSRPNSDPNVQANVNREVPLGLQYCCQSWAIHLATLQELDQNEGLIISIVDDVHEFSQKKLLYWLEVMSLIGRVGEAITIARQTEQLVMVSGLLLFIE